jgi:putative nucleotide binding protein
MSDDGDSDGERTAVVLDFLPRGRPDDDRPQYERSPVALALGETDFRLVEAALTDDAGVNIGDRIEIDPPGGNVKQLRRAEYSDLTSTAESELEYAIDQILDADEDRFVGFYNDAQPITTRLHVLNLLPGIGKKLRNNVLDARKRKPFESYADIEERVSGLYEPKDVLAERIVEELREEDLKYRIFARRDENA